jgi:hypothetical protein
MKFLDYFHNEEAARQCRDQLMERGIEVHIVVDPLACRYPALADIQEVAVLVPDEQYDRARACFLPRSRQAG